MGNYRSVIRVLRSKTGNMADAFFTEAGVMAHRGAGIDVGCPAWAKAGEKPKSLVIRWTHFNSERKEKMFSMLKDGALLQIEGRIQYDTATGKIDGTYPGLNIVVDSIQPVYWGSDKETPNGPANGSESDPIQY